LVHLASPFVLGASGCAAARQLRLPVIAVYQTDVPAYARLYGTGPAGQAASWRRLRKIHNAAARTLAPSTATAADLQSHGPRAGGSWPAMSAGWQPRNASTCWPGWPRCPERGW